jgi:hypothetical protein
LANEYGFKLVTSKRENKDGGRAVTVFWWSKKRPTR